MRRLLEQDLEDLAVGAGILGCGGGGNPYRGKLLARRHLRQGARVLLAALEEVPDDALAVEVFNMGAPVIGMERIPRGDEAQVAVRRLEQRLGRRVTHLVPAEVGGSNSTLPFVVAAQTGLPVVDCDGMGRAFPELQQSVFMVGGAAVSPAVLTDYRHACVLFEGIDRAAELERLARAVTVAMGGAASVASTPMTGAELKRLAIPATLSLAMHLGRAVLGARRSHRDPVAAAAGAARGCVLARARVVGVERRLQGGFARGRLELDGIEESRGRSFQVDFQNENLVLWSEGGPLAVVPDLISLVDLDTAEPVTTEVVRYGLRVAVLGLPAPAALTSPAALEVMGPRAFGYDLDYFELALPATDHGEPTLPSLDHGQPPATDHGAGPAQDRAGGAGPARD